MSEVEIPLNEYGCFAVVSIENGGLVLGIDTGPVIENDGVTKGDSIHTIVDVPSMMALVAVILDAVAQVDPLRPITDELLEWALVREGVQRGSLPKAGQYLSERLVTVAVGLRRRYEQEPDDGG